MIKFKQIQYNISGDKVMASKLDFRNQ